MRPLRLLLDGFGSYRAPTEIDFNDVDFFALVGPTGSGKSTVIDALCFALYGTVPRWDNEREVRNALAPSANRCQVCLVFELAGARYAAARTLQRDKRGQVTTTAARLERLDPEVPPDAGLGQILEASVDQIAEGPDNVKASVQDLLGLSYEHFTQSVLLPQGGFAEFLRATPANRQRLLVELLAFGVYKDVGERARERAKHADNLRVAAQAARDQLTDATPQAEAETAGRLASLVALAEDIDQRLAALAELQRQAAAAKQAADQNGNESAQLTAARMPAEAPGLAAQIKAAEAAVAAGRERRDEAERLAHEAGLAREQLPDKSDTQRLIALYAEQKELTAQAAKDEAELALCRTLQDSRTGQLQLAEQQLAQARDANEAAHRAHAAAGLAETLHVGEDCPVCRQPVSTLPVRSAPADLTAAKANVDSATSLHRQAQRDHTAAEKATAAAETALQVAGERLGKASRFLANAPAEDVLADQLKAITAADEAFARTRAEATARQRELASAEQSRAGLVRAEQQAWTALRAARDKLVGLGAPEVDAGDLAAAWDLLLAWAHTERDERRLAQPALDQAAGSLQHQYQQATAAITGLLAEHGIGGFSDPARAPALVAEHRVGAQRDLQQIRADMQKAALLDKQIAAHREDGQVAKMLGDLLRANQFERWLCSEALDSLVREASATLMELSGGQYELDRDERNDLVVIDYEDAGTRRPVHTLSGGETFQASLALALALSRQVIGLSAGLRELNSMFLDEGFGTLDPDTLETVASTLERLAADSDRMVGVITHVAELAERAPVRFMVSRTGTSSTIRKERT
jgi:DNA repair protein SbcC/Rad50